MIPNDFKTSILIPSQLPEFIREDAEYSKFVAFIQAYYEWMEQTGKVTDRSKNLLNYRDIDNTTNEFLDYFSKDFLPYFPTETLIDKKQAVKVARELYRSKGTPASYQFLFKILYNSDFDIFYTKDAVLKASDGVWYVSKSLKLSTSDNNWLTVKNYRIFGETSKSIATIENVVKTGLKTEVYVSNIERLFQSGEFVRIVDNNNQDILFGGKPLRAKIVGQINQIAIDPNNRGLLYQVGDPVVVYDGLNSDTGIGASAVIGTTTTGSIQRINVVTGGYGYTDGNTTISITDAPGATAIPGSFNPASNSRSLIGMVVNDTINLKRYVTIGNSNYHFSNIATSNANTTLEKALTFDNFYAYPISSVLVQNSGGGISKIPTATATSNYRNESGTLSPLAPLGILAPIQIENGGHGYVANDTITITGGAGIGAYANVKTVDANGAITSVEYVYGTKKYPLGGMGYRNNQLPGLSVVSSNVSAAGASLYVPGIVGEGATFSVVVDRAGSVSTINIVDAGEDYVSTPNVSLKVQDIVVSNVSITNLPIKGDYIYQGASLGAATYSARVNSISILTTNNEPELSLYNIRVFNYTSNPDPTQQLVIDRNINLNMANFAYSPDYNSNGIRVYGDGNARANATFLDGLVVSQGKYINTQGQLSSFDVLQSTTYNNYTYQITVEKEIEKYRDVLLKLLHPTGMNVLGRFAMKSNTSYEMLAHEALSQGEPLSAYTGYEGSTVTMFADFTNKSNNIIQFNNLAGADISTFIFPDTTTIELTPTNGPYVRSEVVSVDNVSNTVTLAANTWLTYSNVATITAVSNSNTINITSLTGAYDLINGGAYSNTSYPLMDIVYSGDTVKIANNSVATVHYVDYESGIIYLQSNLTQNSNSYLSVNRTFVANTSITSNQVKIYGPLGIQYVPQLSTEDGSIITTEDGLIILLG